MTAVTADIAAAGRGADFVVIGDGGPPPVGVVCFHFAGGSAQSFFRWRGAARAAGCALIAAELPGRGRRLREGFVPSLASAAMALAQSFAALAAAMPDKRWVFFGHSMGALLAYETVRRLRADGGPQPQGLIVSARHAPGWHPVSSGLPELSDEALCDYLRHLDGTPAAILDNPAFMAMALPILRADLGLLYGYAHVLGQPLDMPVLTIGASADGRVPLEALVAWGTATQGAFRLRMVPGGHFSLLDEPAIVFDAAREMANGRNMA